RHRLRRFRRERRHPPRARRADRARVRPVREAAVIRFTPPRRVTDLRALLRQPRARLWVFIVATGLLTGLALLLTPPTPSYNIGPVAKADEAKALPPAWNDRQKRVGTAIVTQFLDANVQLDAVATSVAQQAARNAVGPVQVQVVAGEVIVREGSVVTAQDIEKLRALGLASPGVDWRGAIGLLLWAILIAGVLGTYIE